MCQEWIDKLTQFSTVYALASPRTLLCRGRPYLTVSPNIPLCLPLSPCISLHLPISPHISRAPRSAAAGCASSRGPRPRGSTCCASVSQQLAAKTGMPYDEALALRLLSMHSKSSARESQQAEQEAQEIFKRLGVDPSLV